MPGSLPNPVIYFPIKVAVYALSGWVLNKIYLEKTNPLVFGALRVAIGFGVGFILLLAVMPFDSGTNSYADYAWLVFTRLMVWAGMIWFFYERKSLSPLRFFLVVVSGVLLSFGIDAAFSWLDGEFSGMFSIPMC